MIWWKGTWGVEDWGQKTPLLSSFQTGKQTSKNDWWAFVNPVNVPFLPFGLSKLILRGACIPHVFSTVRFLLTWFYSIWIMGTFFTPSPHFLFRVSFSNADIYHCLQGWADAEEGFILIFDDGFQLLLHTHYHGLAFLERGYAWRWMIVPMHSCFMSLRLSPKIDIPTLVGGGKGTEGVEDGFEGVEKGRRRSVIASNVFFTIDLIIPSLPLFLAFHWLKYSCRNRRSHFHSPLLFSLLFHFWEQQAFFLLTFICLHPHCLLYLFISPYHWSSSTAYTLTSPSTSEKYMRLLYFLRHSPSLLHQSCLRFSPLPSCLVNRCMHTNSVGFL